MFCPEINHPPPSSTSSLQSKGLNIRSPQNPNGLKSCSSAGTAFWKCVLCSHPGPCSEKDPVLVSGFAVTILKFFKSFEQRTHFLNMLFCTGPCKLCSQSCPVLLKNICYQSAMLRRANDVLQNVARALPQDLVTGKLR